ncbi:phosphoribosylformylglycinamidine synthase [Anastrepha obliqua]|uniref:phosphoribosylformylglycinamidine synthase n=1 Tax=Anastrepha obliqua TaxID=95512 RepID=UPI002409EE4A|nr:phosphoribosylformylglycinamidine synthase [Anastrepha obliqua]
MPILRYYSTHTWSDPCKLRILAQLTQISGDISSVEVERCYHVESTIPIKTDTQEDYLLRWLLKEPHAEISSLQNKSFFVSQPQAWLIEIGPRFNFSTAFSTNCVNICRNVGLSHVNRLEMSIRYLVRLNSIQVLTEKLRSQIVDLFGDRMTECEYTSENLPINSFNEQLPKCDKPWYHVPILSVGRQALEKVNSELGLAFSEWDMDYYAHLFKEVLKRDPTTVELFDCAQSNSEHSRHWFFRGKMIVDGEEKPESLIKMIMNTQNHTNANNTIKFSDNSSAIRGFIHKSIRPKKCDMPSCVHLVTTESDLIFTAETHNMPTAVAPFSGATTGTGGRLRDVQGVGRGGVPIAGTAGYCVGCLNIPGYAQPYEQKSFGYPASFAKPLKILIEASNGASDYGNKFGEPVIAGFAISYGLEDCCGERQEYVKPIMFSGGMGIMDSTMRQKLDPEKGMLLVKIGGPVYRIGVGGGAASSVEVQGSSSSDLDFNAVQRGDAEMENKLNRVVRACIEMGEDNPILAIHDQGAGGNGNVLKELVEPGFAGAIIFSKEFQLGDPTINALELWGAEYQENNALICKPEHRKLLEDICLRERCPISFIGVVSGNGRVTLIESEAQFERALEFADDLSSFGSIPFDLELKHVLGEMPKREYKLERSPAMLKPLSLSRDFNKDECLERVLSHLAVGSKRFLTNKVDRCVTGLVAQQQCVGPLHTPLADYGLTAISYFSNEGIATSIGTQPIKGILSASAMARMCVAEALSNLVFVKITELADVKCSGNWMWAAKLSGEGARLYDACKEMCQIMQELHIAVDGGKDSLSMAAKVNDKTVKSPGTLVISTYAPCPDITVKVTPDLKGPALGEQTALVWINIENKFRLGGSALAQAYLQQGDECPTVLRSDILEKAFTITQNLLQQRKLLAGHDISDGGLLICLLEMAFGGLSGIQIQLSNVMNQLKDAHIDKAAEMIGKPELAVLYAEECGWVIEVPMNLLPEVQAAYTNGGVPNYYLGVTSGHGLKSNICIKNHSEIILEGDIKTLLKKWERTSFEIEKLQANPDCALEEYNSLDYRSAPKYYCSLDLNAEIIACRATKIVTVAVIREEGVNSDREMMASLIKANFEVHDVTMSDLLSGKTTLDRYRGIVFPGGFSYADTLGSAKGWAANIMFSDLLAPQFQAFKRRNDTFSLGVCNGCQLMGLIGWVGLDDSSNKQVIDVPDVAVLHNKSERFECRWATIRVENSNSMMLHKLKGSILGCWISHGEGRFSFRTNKVVDSLKSKRCVAISYANDDGKPTGLYPLNPNGSVDGIAGLCSEDGRHLALMPHPERCSSMFQWPYVPADFKVNSKESPWQIMFNTAYDWCTKA